LSRPRRLVTGRVREADGAGSNSLSSELGAFRRTRAAGGSDSRPLRNPDVAYV